MGTVLQAALKQHTTIAVNVISAGLAATTRFTLQGLVSLVLSFVIVWDMPAIRRGVESLAHSRLAWLYAETAPALNAFGILFGKALQAQCLVAAVNTALTASGMLFLQLPGVAFLSLIVFFCSFIPVAGVIISTVPVGFVALTEYGVGRLLAVIVLVIVAHAVEAYLLNPAIYSAHLKLHPLIVLVVLVVAEHTLGVWGLLLAVPVTVFTLEFLIKTPEQVSSLSV
jgi:predicted PurR-regulated permease PerM